MGRGISLIATKSGIDPIPLLTQRYLSSIATARGINSNTELIKLKQLEGSLIFSPSLIEHS